QPPPAYPLFPYTTLFRSEFGFPFTLFIYTWYVGHKSALSWEDIRVLAKAGVDIESHSVTHPLLTHPGKPMTRSDYLDWMDHELRSEEHTSELQSRGHLVC